jgi:hypothetical protein
MIGQMHSGCNNAPFTSVVIAFHALYHLIIMIIA